MRSVTLVDSVPYANELFDGVLHRVAVCTVTRVDTIPGVLTNVAPVVVGDSMVYGLRSSEDLVVGLFRYDARTGRVDELQPPAGWVPNGAPALAPDARHVAYLGADTPGWSYGAVASVPDGRVVYRGPTVASRETDAGVDEVRWISPTRFEIRIDLSIEARGTHRIRGRIAPVEVVIDTVP